MQKSCIETLLQVLLGTVKDFIEYIFSLYFCCLTCLYCDDPSGVLIPSTTR